ncbi:hypothetical protein GCM10009548_12210 [Streptomyces malaysiensis subsp. malaysiensis]
MSITLRAGPERSLSAACELPENPVEPGATGQSRGTTGRGATRETTPPDTESTPPDAE